MVSYYEISNGSTFLCEMSQDKSCSLFSVRMPMSLWIIIFDNCLNVELNTKKL